MDNFEPSPQQVRALRDAIAFILQGYNPDDPILYIAGYAGVGKTTLARYIALESGRRVLFAAYTGKAAYVLRSKGCTDASTIHSLIYKPAGESKSDAMRAAEAALADLSFDPPEDKVAAAKLQEEAEKKRDTLLMTERRKPMFTLNHDSALSEADALIVDECSMVDDTMGQDLLSFKVPIIVMGDPMQLPPVGAGGFLTNRTPNHLLTEIHRHAAESGILRLATDIRMTGGFSRNPGHYGADCAVLAKSQVQNLARKALDADQVLVGMNRTRHASNARYRELNEKVGPFPLAGDKIVCLRNNNKMGLLNGSLWRVHESIQDADQMIVDMTISSEEDGAAGIAVCAWAHPFLGREDELKLKKWNRRDNNEFDYGYALTVHKAQGSQWDDVVLFDESGCFRNDKNRWLYTGVTRAAKTLMVVL